MQLCYEACSYVFQLPSTYVFIITTAIANCSHLFRNFCRVSCASSKGSCSVVNRKIVQGRISSVVKAAFFFQFFRLSWFLQDLHSCTAHDQLCCFSHFSRVQYTHNTSPFRYRFNLTDSGTHRYQFPTKFLPKFLALNRLESLFHNNAIHSSNHRFIA